MGDECMKKEDNTLPMLFVSHGFWKLTSTVLKIMQEQVLQNVMSSDKLIHNEILSFCKRGCYILSSNFFDHLFDSCSRTEVQKVWTSLQRKADNC